jgi:hypothetical protein
MYLIHHAKIMTTTSRVYALLRLSVTTLTLLPYVVCVKMDESKNKTTYSITTLKYECVSNIIYVCCLFKYIEYLLNNYTNIYLRSVYCFQESGRSGSYFVNFVHTKT